MLTSSNLPSLVVSSTIPTPPPAAIALVSTTSVNRASGLYSSPVALVAHELGISLRVLLSHSSHACVSFEPSRADQNSENDTPASSPAYG